MVETTQAISGVSLDSRRVQPGWMYVALPGVHTHGARFAADAVARGAVAILTDAAGAALVGDVPVPVRVVDDPRASLGPLAAAVYGYPSRGMAMFGVTGTAGKTMTVALLAAGLTAAGQTAGTIGTLGFTVGGKPVPVRSTTITTPEAPDLQAMLASMAGLGATGVAMEVSSHALALHRVDGIEFEVAGFTNLGRDHLDFHGDQEHYFQAKVRLFEPGRSGCAVVNVDDPWGRRLVDQLAGAGQTVVTTALESPADYRVTRWRQDAHGATDVVAQTPSGRVEFGVGTPGEFSVRNALTAAAMIDQSRFELADALPGFAHAVAPGRMQRVALPEGAPLVVVDFAHTPEEVQSALAALRPGRLIAVLGCGGDRDRGKRGPMGRVAALAADVVVVTDDNPRGEDPAAIRAVVLQEARLAARESGASVLDGGDRASAIRLALESAGPADTVAILGKGHETGQDIGGVVTPFDDVAVARATWGELSDGDVVASPGAPGHAKAGGIRG